MKYTVKGTKTTTTTECSYKNGIAYCNDGPSRIEFHDPYTIETDDVIRYLREKGCKYTGYSSTGGFFYGGWVESYSDRSDSTHFIVERCK